MILTEPNRLAIRTALAAVPGAPSPDELDEAMAAAWNFRNFQALCREIGRIETDLTRIPSRAGIRPDQMIDYLGMTGVDHLVARRLALTMLLAQDGDLAVMRLAEHRELHGTCAHRFDLTTPQWRASIQRAIATLLACAPGKAWHVTLLEGCCPGRAGEPDIQDADLAACLRVIDHTPGTAPDLARSRFLNDEDFAQSEAAERLPGGLLPITLIENVLGMCGPHLPAGMRHLVISAAGANAIYELFEIRLA